MSNGKKSKDSYGIENVNFSLAKKKDANWEKYKSQRIERGFDDTELWNLDSTILKFTLPRLKVFRDKHVGYPTYFETNEAWNAQIDKMIYWMENYLEDKQDGKIKEKMEEGKQSFFKFFEYLFD